MSSDVKTSGPKLLPPSMCSSAASSQPRSDAKSKTDDKKLSGKELSTDVSPAAPSSSSVSQPDPYELIRLLIASSRSSFRSEGATAPKYRWFSGSGVVAPGGQIFDCTAITQGTTDILRLGNSIRVKGLHVRLRINRDPGVGTAYGAIDTCPAVRISVFRDRFPLTSLIVNGIYGSTSSGTSIQNQDWLYIDPNGGTGQTTTTAVRNPYTMERHHVYADEVIMPSVSIAATGTGGNTLVGGGFFWERTFKFEGGGFNTQYSGTAASTECLNALYYAFDSDNPVTGTNPNRLTYFTSYYMWFEDTN